jgi:hypothetical protein
MIISQSFIKDYRAYKAGQRCGNLIKHVWVDGKETPPSDSMHVGTCFEYWFCGNLPKDGKNPITVDCYTTTAFNAKRKTKAFEGKTDQEILDAGVLTVNDMYKPYITAYNNAQRLKLYFATMGLKIIDKGVRKKREVRPGVLFIGTLDLICEVTKTIRFDDGFVLKKGEKIVIDLKLSGMIDNKWDEMGWQWTPEQKRYHGTQAIQYHYISDGLPFYFLVLSPTNETDIEFFRTVVSEDSIEKHIAEGIELKEDFDYMKDVDGFRATPSLSRCLKCPLYGDCKDQHGYPHATFVEI